MTPSTAAPATMPSLATTAPIPSTAAPETMTSLAAPVSTTSPEPAPALTFHPSDDLFRNPRQSPHRNRNRRQHRALTREKSSPRSSRDRLRLDPSPPRPRNRAQNAPGRLSPADDPWRGPAKYRSCPLPRRQVLNPRKACPCAGGRGIDMRGRTVERPRLLPQRGPKHVKAIRSLATPKSAEVDRIIETPRGRPGRTVSSGS